MPQQPPQDNRGFVEHWRRVAPLLEAVRERELRDYDHAANVEIIDSLLQLGIDHGEPRTTSGLVELQRRLHRMADNADPKDEPGASATGASTSSPATARLASSRRS